MDPTVTLTAERLLRRLEWRVVRRLDGMLQGEHRSLFRGAGVDFTDLREYEPGDDLRHIEWNVTARLDTPFVREYVEDREVTTWLLLDVSRSMAFGPVERQKDRVTTEVAAAVAVIMSRGGGRVGAVLFDASVRRIVPPRTGRRHVARIVQQLLAPRPDAAEVTDLARAVRALDSLARRRSVVVLVTDFVTHGDWAGALGRLARRHEVVALHVTDPREVDLPAAGLLYVEDAETGEQIFVDTDDEGFRSRLRALTLERRTAVARACERAGVDLHTVSTGEDLVPALVRVASARRRRR
jgi:uncharacterized protein (DUF58 family)